MTISVSTRRLATLLGIGGPAQTERLEAIERRIALLGGLPGLWVSGPESLSDLLPRRAQARLAGLFELLSSFVSMPPLPNRIEDAVAVNDFFKNHVALLSQEAFWVLMLDARARPIAVEMIAKGTLTACLVHPREVFAPALRRRAAQIIVVHNHPSHDPDPSDEDRMLSARLAEAGALLGIPVLDHVVVAANGFRSLGPGT